MFKRAVAKILTAALLLGSLGGALAPGLARAEVDYLSAARVLGKLGLVKGDERGLRPRETITRAEMAKLVAVALGMEAEARQFKGAGFTDTVGHWSEGYIGMARRLGVLKGYPEGDFRPQNPVMYAEALAVLARMVGVEPGDEPWPYTYVAPAREAGILPAEMDLSGRLYDPAIRGDLFVLLKQTVVDVKNYAGKSLAQLYLDKTPPKVAVDPQPDETESARLTVTGSARDAARIKVNGTEVPVSDGYFEAQVGLRIGPNTIRVQAWDEAGNLAEQTVKVIRRPGLAATIEVTGPKRVGAGGAATFKVVLRDRDGVEIPDRSQVEAVVSPNLGQFDPVSGKFTAGAAAGQATVSLSAGMARTSVTVEVTAGALERLAITPAELSLSPGDRYTFFVTGLDANQNPVPVTGVKWSATTGAITDQGLFTSAAEGLEATITAAVDGKTATAAVHPQNYRVAAVRVEAPSTVMIANQKSTVTLTATLLDEQGTKLTDYKGTLRLATSAPGVAVPVLSEVPVRDGVASFEVRAGNVAGETTISVSTNLGKTGTQKVRTSSQNIAVIRLSGRVIPGTSTATIEAQALDQEMNPIVSALPQVYIVRLTWTSDRSGVPADALTFRSTGQRQADIVLSAVDPATGAVRTQTPADFQSNAGTFTISGAVNAAGAGGTPGAGSATAGVQVLSAALETGWTSTASPRLAVENVPDTVAGEVRPIYVQVRDGAGNPVSSGPSLEGLSVTLRDQNGTTWAPTVSPAAGLGRARFDVRQTRAGTYTYTATATPGWDVATSNLTAVWAAPLSGITLKVLPEVLPADGSSKAKLRAELVDAYGNRIQAQTGAGGTVAQAPNYPVTFLRLVPATGATLDFPQTERTSADGVAEVELTAGRIIGTETFRATVPNPNVPGAVFSAQAGVVTRGMADHLTLRYGDNDGDGRENGAGDSTVTAGRLLNVAVEVRDNRENVATYDDAAGIAVTARNLATGLEAPGLLLSAGQGRAVFTLNLTGAGRYAIKAERGTLVKALTLGFGGGSVADAAVTAAHSTGVAVELDVAALAADGGNSHALVTVRLMDVNRNPAVNQSGVPVTVTLSTNRDSSYGYFTVDGQPYGFAVQTRTVVIPPGASGGPAVRYYSGRTAGTAAITATTADGAADSKDVTLLAAMTPAGFRFDPVQAVQAEPWTYADGVLTGQTIAVTVVDAQGRRVAGLPQSVTVYVDGDAAIVARYDAATGTWVSLDTPPGNGVGEYSNTGSFIADRGRLLLRVRSNTPGTRVITVSGPGLAPVSTTAQFASPGPDYLTVQAERRMVPGGGTEAAIQAKVRDVYGNVLTDVSGPIQFKLSTAGAGGLLATTAEMQNGVATVVFRSGAAVTTPIDVTVMAWSSGLRRNDGAVLTIGGSEAGAASDTFRVDGGPRVTEVRLGSVTTDGKPGTGETLTFTFSEAINPGTVHPALSGGPMSNPAGVQVVFDAAAQSVSFPGLPALGVINLGSGAISAGKTFAVAAVERVGENQIRVRFGSGTGADAAVSFGTQVTLVMPGAVRDADGSTVTGVFPVSVIGQF